MTQRDSVALVRRGNYKPRGRTARIVAAGAVIRTLALMRAGICEKLQQTGRRDMYFQRIAAENVGGR